MNDPEPPFDPDPQPATQPEPVADPLDAARDELAKAAGKPKPRRKPAKKSKLQIEKEKQAAADKDDILRVLLSRGEAVAGAMARAMGMPDEVFRAIVAEREEQLETERQKLAEEQRAAMDKEAAAQSGGSGDGRDPPPPAAAGAGDGDDKPVWRLKENPVKPLPKDSPVEPLGRGPGGSTFYYLNPARQLVELQSRHNADDLRTLFSTKSALDWVWKNFPKYSAQKFTQTGWDAAALQESLKSACGECGIIYPSEQLRGVGAWEDNAGGLVLHCGDGVWFQGEWRTPGRLGENIYVADRPRPRPHGDTGTDADIARVLDIFDSWRWRAMSEDAPEDLPGGHSIQAVIMTGFTAGAMFGGALGWRPMIWITGDFGGGKSTLLAFVGHVMGGDMVKAADATPAGVWTEVGYSARPVLLDEVENNPDNYRNKALMELVRKAASGDFILRGSSNHTGARFQARSSFLLSSIIHPSMHGQDVSRFCVFDVSKMTAQADLVYSVADVARSGAVMRARVIANWHRWRDTLAAWMGTLGNMGHAAREQKQYGTLLAMYDMVMGSEPLDSDTRAELCACFPVETAAESNSVDMLGYLRSKQLPNVFRGGNVMTVDALVRRAARLDYYDPGDGDGGGYQSARNVLAAYGINLVGDGPEATIYLPNKHEGLRGLFRGSGWSGEAGTSGGWAQALPRFDEVKKFNSSKWGGRGWSLPVRLFLALDAEELGEWKKRANPAAWTTPQAGKDGV